MVEATGIEPATSWSQTTRATNCATPRFLNCLYIIAYFIDNFKSFFYLFEFFLNFLIKRIIIECSTQNIYKK